MKTLYISRENCCDGFGGDKIYSKHCIKLFSEISQELTLLTSGSSVEGTFSSNVFPIILPIHKMNYFQFLFTLKPTLVARFYSKKLQKKLTELLQTHEYNLIVVDHLSSSWAYAILQKYSIKHQVKIVYITHNNEVDIAKQKLSVFSGSLIKRMVFFLDYYRVFRMEKKIMSVSNFVSTISEDDLNSYSKLFNKNFFVIRPNYEGFISDRKLSPSIPRRICISSSFYWSLKQDNLLQFLKACYIELSNAGIEIQLVGTIPNDFKNILQTKYPKLNIQGQVDDISSYLENSRMGILIDQAGGGFKLKTLDYFFHRLPIAGFRSSVTQDFKHFRTNYKHLCDTFNCIKKFILQYIDDIDFLNRIQQENLEIAKRLYLSDEAKANKKRLLNVLNSR